MNKLIKITQALVMVFLLSSCENLINKIKPIVTPEEVINEETNSKKERIEKRFSCGEDGVSKYIDEGWVIVEEFSEEKICSWKSYPASKRCDMEKDKGCKLTKPDKIGEEKIYILER